MRKPQGKEGRKETMTHASPQDGTRIRLTQRGSVLQRAAPHTYQGGIAWASARSALRSCCSNVSITGSLLAMQHLRAYPRSIALERDPQMTCMHIKLRQLRQVCPRRCSVITKDSCQLRSCCPVIHLFPLGPKPGLPCSALQCEAGTPQARLRLGQLLAVQLCQQDMAPHSGVSVGLHRPLLCA